MCCLLAAPGAIAAPPVFSQVSGSPFAAGNGPVSVAFSPGGGLLATANQADSTVSVFSVGAGGALTEINGSPFATGNAPRSVVFSPDGTLLATANQSDNTVSVFAVGAGGALTEVKGSPFATGVSPFSVAFSPGGGLLATANEADSTVSVFSVGAGGALTEVLGSPFATDGNPFSVAFSPDGTLLATSNQVPSKTGPTGMVSVFSVGAGGALTEISGSPFAAGPGFPFSIAFNPSGTLLATADAIKSPTGPIGAISMFSVGAGGALTQISGSPFATGRFPFSVAFSPGGGLLATANQADSTVSVFSVGAGGALSEASGSPFATGGSPFSVAFSPGGGLLATANQADSTVSVLAEPPRAQISSPADNQTYNLNQPVATSFSCTDPVGASGISSCTDSNGGAGSSGALDTSTAGAHTYIVTATSADGLTATATIHYTVLASPTGGMLAPPRVQILAPADNRTYSLGQSVATSFLCAEASGGPGISSCLDSNGGYGSSGALDTSRAGAHIYTVTATSADGLSATAMIHYTVNAHKTGGLAHLRVTRLRARALRRHCETELNLARTASVPHNPCTQGLITITGTIDQHANGQRIAITLRTTIADGMLVITDRVRVTHGRFNVECKLPGRNTDASGDKQRDTGGDRWHYTVAYPGNQSLQPATITGKLTLEVETR